MFGIKAKKLKLAFLTFSVCLAGLSMSDWTTFARSDDGIEGIIFKRIVEADEKGKLDSVKEDIQRVLKLNPKHAGATYYAGKFSFMSGNMQNAEKFMKRIIDDAKYGGKAKAILAEMKMSKQQSKNVASVKMLIAGKAYEQALKMCEEFLLATPDSADIIYQAAIMECLLNDHDKAETYALKYHDLRLNNKETKELNLLIDGWFMPPSKENEAIDKLLEITNRDLLLPPVREKLKKMVSNSGQVEKYERFISRELAEADTDKSALERDLIKFYIDNGCYSKALEVLDRRPLDSLNDNLLYVDLLTKSGNEEKAIENSGYLIDANKNELSCYKAWVTAWVAYVDKVGSLPGKTDAATKKFITYGENVLLEVKPEPLIIDDPEMLIGLFRIAVMIGQDRYAEELKKHVCEIKFSPELVKNTLKFIDQIVIMKKSDLALDILQSAWNSQPDDFDIPLKMAEITMDTDPEAAAKILEVVMKERPEHHRAFMIWIECMSRLDKPDEAVKAIGERLKQPDLNEIIVRQLNAKLELLAMQGADTSEIEMPEKKERHDSEDGFSESGQSSDGESLNSDESSGDTLSEYEAPR